MRLRALGNTRGCDRFPRLKVAQDSRLLLERHDAPLRAYRIRYGVPIVRFHRPAALRVALELGAEDLWLIDGLKVTIERRRGQPPGGAFAADGSGAGEHVRERQVAGAIGMLKDECREALLRRRPDVPGAKHRAYRRLTLLVAPGMRWAFPLAAVLGAISGGGGYAAAFFFDLPVGATQTVMAAVMVALAMPARMLRR